MKIESIQSVDPVSATKPAAKVLEQKPDKVSLGGSEALQKRIAVARSAAGLGRAAQLKALEQQIHNGTYQPSASRIAERLLSSAETDAQLLAMLNR